MEQKTKMHTEFLQENVKRRDHSGDPDVVGRITLKKILKI
jgi:hypothetical protein